MTTKGQLGDIPSLVSKVWVLSSHWTNWMGSLTLLEELTPVVHQLRDLRLEILILVLQCLLLYADGLHELD